MSPINGVPQSHIPLAQDPVLSSFPVFTNGNETVSQATLNGISASTQQWTSSFHHATVQPEFEIQSHSMPMPHQRTSFQIPGGSQLASIDHHRLNALNDGISSHAYLKSLSMMQQIHEANESAPRSQNFDERLFQIMNSGDSTLALSNELSTHSTTAHMSSIPTSVRQDEVFVHSSQIGIGSPLDQSEFPTLDDIRRSSGQKITTSSPFPSTDSVSKVTSANLNAAVILNRGTRNGEFSMHSEDFPLLGENPDRGSSESYSRGLTAAQNSQIRNRIAAIVKSAEFEHPRKEAGALTQQLIDSQQISRGAGVLLLTNDLSERQPNSISNEVPSRLAQKEKTSPTKNGEAKSSEGPGKYGMEGLLGRLSKPEFNLMSMGVDINDLGLDLKSPKPLWANFKSPFDGAFKIPKAKKESKIPKFKLPSYYSIDAPPLKLTNFNRFQLETLFYIFYKVTGDVAQQLAAWELDARGWKYHKGLKVWFTKPPGTYALSERSSYIYFDVSTWEKRAWQVTKMSFSKDFMGEDELRAISIPSYMLDD